MENEYEMRSRRGSMSLGFYDISNMSTQASIFYLLGIMAFFGIVFYILVGKLFNKPVDFAK